MSLEHTSAGNSSDHGPGYTVADIRMDIGADHIGGRLYTPPMEGTGPLVICSHGFTATYENLVPTCEMLAEAGVAAICFDFRNGNGKLSSGRFVDMSVMTEVADLQHVLSFARNLPMINPDRIVLLGHSQGGIVSALVAARQPDEVAGLILAYPAFSIPDDVHRLFRDRESLPDTYDMMDATVGKVYAEDVWDLDVMAEIGDYKKPVLIMHGTEDEIVSVSYSEKAAEVYSQATFVPIQGAGHGFHGDALQQSYAAIKRYLHDIGILS